MKLQTIKILAFSATVVLSFCALAQIFVGVPYYIKFKQASYILTNAWEHPALFSICFGSILLVVTVFGYIAIGFNAYGLTIIYTILLAIAFLTSFFFGLVHCYYADIEDPVFDFRLKHDLPVIEPEELDKLQRHFGCCGIESYMDYLVLWKWWGIDKPIRDFTTDATSTRNPNHTWSQPLGSTTTPNASRNKNALKLPEKWHKVPVKIVVDGKEQLIAEQSIWKTYNLTVPEDDKSKLDDADVLYLEFKNHLTTRKSVEEDPENEQETPESPGEPPWYFMDFLKQFASTSILSLAKCIFPVLFETTPKLSWDKYLNKTIQEYLDPYMETIRQVWYLKTNSWKARRRWFYSDQWSMPILQRPKQVRHKYRDTDTESEYETESQLRRRTKPPRVLPLTTYDRPTEKEPEVQKRTKPPRVIQFWPKAIDNLPYSCCLNPSTSCTGIYDDTYEKGCRFKIMDYWRSSTMELGVMAIMFSFVILQAILLNAFFIAYIKHTYCF